MCFRNFRDTLSEKCSALIFFQKFRDTLSEKCSALISFSKFSRHTFRKMFRVDLLPKFPRRTFRKMFRVDFFPKILRHIFRKMFRVDFISKFSRHACRKMFRAHTRFVHTMTVGRWTKLASCTFFGICQAYINLTNIKYRRRKYRTGGSQGFLVIRRALANGCLRKNLSQYFLRKRASKTHGNPFSNELYFFLFCKMYAPAEMHNLKFDYEKQSYRPCEWVFRTLKIIRTF